jgi:hypothetical protein
MHCKFEVLVHSFRKATQAYADVLEHAEPKHIGNLNVRLLVAQREHIHRTVIGIWREDCIK